MNVSKGFHQKFFHGFFFFRNSSRDFSRILHQFYICEFFQKLQKSLIKICQVWLKKLLESSSSVRSCGCFINISWDFFSDSISNSFKYSQGLQKYFFCVNTGEHFQPWPSSQGLTVLK